MKKISDIIDTKISLNICGITDDSRDVKKGFLFVATRGFNVDHYDYIEDAINNGAVCIISDRNINIDVPLIIVDNINEKYYDLCSKYYDVDPKEFNIIGITGTDGKTTTASIIYKIINNKEKIAYIGTNGFDICGKHYNTNNTTPCISDLYKYLSIIKENDCKNIVMEVSSESLLHKRIDKFKFKYIGFTNINEDHLNIHKTLENYIKCKLSLIDYLDKDGYIVVNGDDKILNNIKDKRIISFGRNNNNDFTFNCVNNICKESVFNLNDNINNNIYNIRTKLLGDYNIYNVSLAFIICKCFGIDTFKIIEYIYNINFIIGRREYLDFGQNYDIILDYAHTYNGIKSLIESVSSYDKVVVVTGAAGGREKEKRKIIGKYLLDNVFLVIFTMDDPRYEDVNDIIDDMISLSDKDNYIRIKDRKNAITYALSRPLNDNSVVLIIGKGRDNYMAIKDKKIPYSDYDTICKYFENSCH